MNSRNHESPPNPPNKFEHKAIPMNTPTQNKYAKATEIAEIPDGTLKYSIEAGFFIEFWIYQRRGKRTWETISHNQIENDAEEAGLESPGSLIKAGTHRMIETYRPISRDQAIRLFLDDYDNVGGMMSVISKALDGAGIAKLERGGEES